MPCVWATANVQPVNARRKAVTVVCGGWNGLTLSIPDDGVQAIEPDRS
jgi:hypothetical protein